ncbi:RNA-binding S4 domain-containing protein [Leptolyngbya ohadii]|uniref:RNA-binding S4 domain-containing protein n=1 Tax=Leptolyngbya ohadii TaxID=1962290 RepID=UPI000B59A558|nr:RNA-binding S4 domain-containing protein [Leptolyngbya ohadii]
MTDEMTDETIKLDQFLKLIGMVETGGEAKYLIQSGEVQVNEAVETRRGRKLSAGDRVTLRGRTFLVKLARQDRE